MTTFTVPSPTAPAEAPLGSRILLAVLGLSLLGLTACGGGDSEVPTSSNTVARSASAIESTPSPLAWLNAQSLEQAEAKAKSTAAETTPLDAIAEGQIAAWDDYASGAVARKSAAVSISVYRFYNSRTTAHFYTINESERVSTLANPQFSFDGPAFRAVNEPAPGLSPVYRFYNRLSGVHFYTISESEKANILATLPNYTLEGVAYYASQVAGRGLSPLYRFYVPAKGFHFYTADAAERTSIQTNLSATYTYEGPAYYVPSDTAWNADELPHTGIKTSQCYGSNILIANSDFFGTCSGSSGGLINFNRPLTAQQDSQRTAHNPMAYGTVYRFTGLLLLAQPKTSCVNDLVTGLTWEGKTDDGGLRDKDNTYTNQGGGAASDASGYVASVNGTNLCGYNDWRLPTALELVTLNNYGVAAAGVSSLDPVWFPNSVAGYFWSRETRSATEAWAVIQSSTRYEDHFLRTSARSVRLVRGSMGNVILFLRYTFSTLAYGSDGPNNLVTDKLTGLQWRRCLEGQTWNGSDCSGTATAFTHRAALVHSSQATIANAGWRLPNVKEAASILDKSRSAAPYFSPSAFPGVGAAILWTTTGYESDPLNTAYGLSGNFGWTSAYPRSSSYNARLVR